MTDQDDKAYQFYVESLLLVVQSLKQDTSVCNLTIKDKCNLIEFAKQSVGRVCKLLQKEESEPERDVNRSHPSAPILPEVEDNIDTPPPNLKPFSQSDLEEQKLMAQYHRRYNLASSTVEKQNLELELARELVEKAAITRNRLMQATAWAMETAHLKFCIDEKLKEGRLTDSDFKMQRLFAISLQFNHGSSWITQMAFELFLYPYNTKIVRNVLENVLTDNSHPVKATMNKMQQKVEHMIDLAKRNSIAEGKDIMKSFDSIIEAIKTDLNIILEVVKALFEPLNTDKNISLTSEVIFHVYFSQLKQEIISLLRLGLKEVESKLNDRIKENILRKDSDISPAFELSETCKEAITKLHYITTLHNPYDMLSCTVHIFRILANSDFDKKHCTSMGADELLPRLCQVVLMSGLPSICAEAAFMEYFMPVEKALGEEGYAVTMLQSAIVHLTNS